MNKHKDKIIAILKDTNPTLPKKHKVDFKNLFGAVVLFVDGRIFASSGKFGIALRLPDEA